MRRVIITAAALALAIGSTAACATKKYVAEQVGSVSTKVDTLSGTLEETQERTRRNETRIGEVDQTAQAARGAATQAQQTAQAADTKAVSAAEAARMAAEKAEAVEKKSGRIVYEVVLSEDAGNFKFGQSVLPDEAKARIDQMIGQLLADPKGAFFEIEGHTDNTGGKAINERVGLERAEAVKMYLYEQHKIPLHKMNVISYGEDKPAADNKTREGRAQNRRVVIRVLG
jgi:outer membrane protein OmpA-like peptidoglycan-associated protein